jgi:hypothetical protein
MIDLHSPVVLAVLIGWVLSVGMHEFAHGIVAYWAGDYTIRERGGLTLNPLQYIDPLTSIIFPLIFLLMGGLPLPGGATFIRRDLIKSRLANCAVSLAGPAVNLLLFVVCAALLQPKWGAMRPPQDMHDWFLWPALCGNHGVFAVSGLHFEFTAGSAAGRVSGHQLFSSAGPANAADESAVSAFHAADPVHGSEQFTKILVDDQGVVCGAARAHGIRMVAIRPVFSGLCARADELGGLRRGWRKCGVGKRRLVA